MYVDIVPNRNSPPAILLRESRREGKKTHKRTIANISHLPMDQVHLLKQVLKGEKLVRPTEAFVIQESWPHGHVEAVLGTLRKIGLERMIASQPSRQRDLVVAMIVEQILHHESKLADTRNWHSTTLAQELGVEDADENDLYAALDWLLARQKRIEKKLGKRHFSEGDCAFYDVTSSYYEGRTCGLARWGNNRDGKKGRKVIVFGTLADQEGRPVGVDVYPGNTGDPTTIPDQVAKLRQAFGLTRLVLVGDRGLLTQTQIEYLKRYPGLGWISALRSKAIRQLIDKGHLGISLFDTRNLAEIHSPDYPNERLVACYNPLMAEERNRKRRELLDVTETLLRKIRREVDRRTKKPLKKQEIGLKVGRVLNKFKMAKHFDVTIEDSTLEWQRRREQIRREEMLDGIYIIRTSEPKEAIFAEQTVKQYKNLTLVEWIYRTVKGLAILIRPIRHREANRVRAHIFLCMLAYYVVWHMRKALTPFLFEDEELDLLRETRDPVAKAEPSQSAKKKKRTLTTSDGFTVHSLATLLNALAKRCKHRCYVRGADPQSSFFQLTEPDALQQRAFELLGLMRPVN
jgi:transposase